MTDDDLNAALLELAELIETVGQDRARKRHRDRLLRAAYSRLDRDFGRFVAHVRRLYGRGTILDRDPVARDLLRRADAWASCDLCEDHLRRIVRPTFTPVEMSAPQC